MAMQSSAVRVMILVPGVVLLLFVAGCQSSVPPEALQQLPAPQARELQVYSSQHSVIFDPRIHTMDTCPFLTYLPHEASSRHDTSEYAMWLHDFYMHKHQEEQSIWGCTCNQEVYAPVQVPSPARQ